MQEFIQPFFKIICQFFMEEIIKTKKTCKIIEIKNPVQQGYGCASF